MLCVICLSHKLENVLVLREPSLFCSRQKAKSDSCSLHPSFLKNQEYARSASSSPSQTTLPLAFLGSHCSLPFNVNQLKPSGSSRVQTYATSFRRLPSITAHGDLHYLNSGHRPDRSLQAHYKQVCVTLGDFLFLTQTIWEFLRARESRFFSYMSLSLLQSWLHSKCSSDTEAN